MYDLELYNRDYHDIIVAFDKIVDTNDNTKNEIYLNTLRNGINKIKTIMIECDLAIKFNETYIKCIEYVINKTRKNEQFDDVVEFSDHVGDYNAISLINNLINYNYYIDELRYEMRDIEIKMDEYYECYEELSDFLVKLNFKYIHIDMKLSRKK